MSSHTNSSQLQQILWFLISLGEILTVCFLLFPPQILSLTEPGGHQLARSLESSYLSSNASVSGVHFWEATGGSKPSPYACSTSTSATEFAPLLQRGKIFILSWTWAGFPYDRVNWKIKLYDFRDQVLSSNLFPFHWLEHFYWGFWAVIELKH